MKNLFPAILIISILFSPLLSASQYHLSGLSISAGNTWQKENFRWSIAGNSQGASPNVYSELIFKPIWSAGFYVSGNYKFSRRNDVHIHYSKAFTFSGRGTDTDYGSDNRTSPFYTGNFDSNKGNAQKLSANFSHIFIHKKFLKTSAAIGYSSYTQKFFLLSKSIPDLNTSYIAWWQGPQAAVNATFSVKEFSSDLFFGYQLLKYKGDANWNINNLFKHPLSFRQKANGYGVETGIRLNYAVASHWKFNITGSIAKFKTSTGVDEAFLADGSNVKTQFNGALRKGMQLGTGLCYRF